ncbi:MAG: carbohydrate ABC transporter substrate-binding protein [Clostridiales bacterium]|nr:carbohydrate ABC transporter substrate-binding protein [Clostridiales bacterium]
MKRRIKPFTLFLCMLIGIYLLIGTKIFLFDYNKDKHRYNNDLESAPLWTGIITLWDVSYVETGTGSNANWLNPWIDKFERQNPGVFIDVRKLNPQRAEMYFSGSIDKDILPDIITIPPHQVFNSSTLYEDLSIYFNQEELERIVPLAQKSILGEDYIRGVPIMMGTYALFFNKDLLREQEISIEDTEINYAALDNIMNRFPYTKGERGKEINYYGFGSYNTRYSKPILSMIYNNKGKIQDDLGYKYIHSWLGKEKLVPEDIANSDKDTAMKLFLEEQRVGMFLGNTRTLYRARALQSQGKGFELGISILPLEGKEGLFQDQIISYGLIKKDDKEKTEMAIAFLKSLLNDEAQIDLKRIGMFPIVKDIDGIYENDPEMQILEERLENFKFYPNDSYWQDNIDEIMKIFSVESNDESGMLE